MPRILILERGKEVLTKVKVSGGGRCNVTHACFIPRDLSGHYPRGEKELLGPFHQFACGDMLDWLDKHGVETKIEEDGRIFPTTDDSQTIIDCFLNAARNDWASRYSPGSVLRRSSLRRSLVGYGSRPHPLPNL
jgi:predicted flavoprotein YhiN